MKKIMILLIVAVLFGCDTIEPPRIENGRYFNTKYQFSIRVPDGWEYSKSTLKRFKSSMTFEERRFFNAAFSDKSNTLHILVGAEKTQLDWSDFQSAASAFITQLDVDNANTQYEMFANPAIKFFHYEIYNNLILNCIDYCLAYHVSFQVDSMRCFLHTIIYKSQDRRLYKFNVFLIAHEDKFDEGFAIFDAVVESFQPYSLSK